MRATQQQRILTLLNSQPNQWVPLYDILDLHISQFGARILELRLQGYDIQNRKEWHGGICKSWYKYVPQERQLAFIG